MKEEGKDFVKPMITVYRDEDTEETMMDTPTPVKLKKIRRNKKKG